MSISIPWRGRLGFAVLLILTAASTFGCGSSGQIVQTVAEPVGTAAAVDTAAPMPAATSASDVRPGSQLPPGNGGNASPGAARDDLKLVYTGSLDLLVDDLDAALAKGRTAVLAAGGYIGGSDENRNGDVEAAVIMYRIPASRWEDALASLRGVAKEVLGEKTQASEIGGQIVDLEARLRNLRASEQVLVGIAEKTDKVSDLLEVQARISDVRGQIEQLDGQRAALEDQVAYGTLVTTYGLEVAQVEEAKAGWDPATDIDGASATLLGGVQTAISGAIWFGIVWLPVILIVVVVLLIARWVFRRFVPTVPGGGPMTGWGSGG